jgi:hypothetical protein
VVVRGEGAAEFATWARALPEVTSVERARADFEDVFLGLVTEQLQGPAARAAGEVAP